MTSGIDGARASSNLAFVSAPTSSERFEVEPNASTHFAWLRTRLSVERTLMSSVRTSIALIGFGFSIVTFLERLNRMPGVRAALEPHAPRYLGLSLIAIGTLALCVSVWQYHRVLRYLWTRFSAVAGIEKEPERTPLGAVAVSLILVGLWAFAAVLLRVV